MNQKITSLAHNIADRAVIADIETEAVCHFDELQREWYDTRPMLDPKYQPDCFIEMSRQALEYGELRGLFTRHRVYPHLVRIQPSEDAHESTPQSPAP